MNEARTFDPVGGRAAGAPLPGLSVATAFASGAMALASSQPLVAAVPLLVMPVIEESLFRAGLQECLLRHRVAPWCANLATALAFMLAHCLGRGFELVSVAVLLPALVLGWTYGRYRSLRLCIALHMLMNMAWIETGAGHWTLPLLRSP